MSMNSTLDNEEYSIDGGEDPRIMLFSKDASREDKIDEIPSGRESLLEPTSAGSPIIMTAKRKEPLSPPEVRRIKMSYETGKLKVHKRLTQQTMIAGVR
jgi:hypothetical protein